MTEDIKKLRESGLKSIKNEEYGNAIDEFTKIIDINQQITEDNISFVIEALNNRSICYNKINNNENSIKDINKAIEIFNCKYSDEDVLKIEPHKRKENDLINNHCVSLGIRGRYYDDNNKLLEALIDFKKAVAFIDECDSNNSLKKFYKSCGFDTYDMNDKKLKPFLNVFENLATRDHLYLELNNLLNYLNNDKIIQIADVEYFIRKRITNILSGVLTIYSNDVDIVKITLHCLIASEKLGIASVYASGDDVKDIIIVYKDSIEIAKLCITFLSLCNESFYQSLANENYIGPVLHCFSLNFDQDQIDKIFFVLFSLASKENMVLEIANNSLTLENIFKHKTLGSALLLSRLTQITQLSQIVYKEIGIKWIIELIKPDLDKEKLTNLIISVSRIVLASDPSEEDSILIFDTFLPIISKNLKDCSIVSNTVAAFCLIIDIIPEKFKDNKVITTFCVCLGSHKKEQNAAQNIIYLLYKIALKGGVIPQHGINQALNALHQHPTCDSIVENTCALCIELNHPKKKELYDASIKQCPNSATLLKYAKSINL